MRGKAAVVLFIVVFLLIAAVIGTVLTEKDMNKAPEAAGPVNDDPPVIYIPVPETSAVPQTAAPTAPQPETPPPAETPAPTVFVPTPEPPPAVTPEPTPEPTAPPVPAGTSLGSGSFRSDTGVGLNIRADWSARTVNESQVEVSVSVSVDSYSLHLIAVPNAINMNLGGQYVSLDAPAVDYDGSAAINTPMASKTFTVDLAEGTSSDFNLDVVWNFGGTYQQEELPAIECGGTVSLSR